MNDIYKGNYVLSDDDLPNLSIITPCYRRRHFLPLMITNLINFDYPKDKLTWVLYQDGDTDMFETPEHKKYIEERLGDIKLTYYYDPKNRKTIGEKRNYCIKKLNTNKFVAMMDSDDIYLPTYPRYAVSTLKKNKMGIVGSQSMLFTYPFHNYQMSAIQCQHKRQIHEGCSCISVKHFRQTGGFQKTSQGEGTGLLDYVEYRAQDIDITLCMICVDHGENTISKEMFRDKRIAGQLGGVHFRVLDAIMKQEYPDKFKKYEIYDENDKLVDTDNVEDIEQRMVETYVKPHHRVLELGARYGSVSCKCNKILRDRTNQVSVEPDSRVWEALKKNRHNHNGMFHIIEGFCSTKKMSLTNLDECLGGYGAYAVDDPLTTIPSYTLQEIKEMTKIDKFDVLIADCEGYLMTFFEENPDFYDEIELISFETDRDDTLDYSPVFNTLKEKGFILNEQDRNIYTFAKPTKTNSEIQEEKTQESQ
jgi:FkbM family methyltransferase